MQSYILLLFQAWRALDTWVSDTEVLLKNEIYNGEQEAGVAMGYPPGFNAYYLEANFEGPILKVSLEYPADVSVTCVETSSLTNVITTTDNEITTPNEMAIRKETTTQADITVEPIVMTRFHIVLACEYQMVCPSEEMFSTTSHDIIDGDIQTCVSPLSPGVSEYNIKLIYYMPVTDMTNNVDTLQVLGKGIICEEPYVTIYSEVGSCMNTQENCQDYLQLPFASQMFKDNMNICHFDAKHFIMGSSFSIFIKIQVLHYDQSGSNDYGNWQVCDIYLVNTSRVQQYTS